MTLTTVNPALLDTQAQYTGFKNRIYNAQMQIDQRNAGAAVSAAGLTLDRWILGLSTTGAVTVQQDSTAPAGFTKSLKVTVTATDTISGTEYVAIRQKIEGYNVADLGFGTASASTVTLSFWVRSSITGTFGGVFLNSAQNRVYPYTYTISSANTFEYKTVTIAGDTTGTWVTDNGTGLDVWFSLGVGSTYSGTAGAWSSSFALSATGAASIMGTSGATFYITGVQLEKGSTATSFDYRPYGTELALCQRYCFLIKGQSDFSNAFSRYICFGTSATGILWMPTFPVQMRTPPSLLTKNFNGSSIDIFNYNTGGAGPVFSSVTLTEGDVVHAQVAIGVVSASGAGNIISWRWGGNQDAYIGFSAEL
jgi:hypothetical protein